MTARAFWLGLVAIVVITFVLARYLPWPIASAFSMVTTLALVQRFGSGRRA